MDTIVLSHDFGKYRKGDKFEVIKRSKTTTIVDVRGKRTILPNEVIEGASVPKVKDSGPAVGESTEAPAQLVELTENQDRVRIAVQNDEDLDVILKDYQAASGLGPTEAKEDIVFIAKHLSRGSVFKVRPAVGPYVPRPTVANEMSEAEAEVLQRMLSGKPIDSDVLDAASNTEEPEEQPIICPNNVWLTDRTNCRPHKYCIKHILHQ